MTEFAGSTPIGGVAVAVDYDLTGLPAAEARLKSRLEKLEKDLAINVPVNVGGNGRGSGWRRGGGWNGGSGGGGGGPNIGGTSNGDVSMGVGGFQQSNTAQQRFNRRQQALWATYNARQAAGGGGAAGGAPGAGGAPTPSPGGGGGGAGGGAGGGVAFGTSLGRFFSIYGIVRTAEAILQVGVAAKEATANFRAAMNNTMAMKAMIEQRSAYESAAGQIPLAGGLGIAIRNAWDSFTGNSQSQINRNMTEAQMTEEYYQARSDAMANRRVLMAQTTAAGFYAGGSSEADIGSINAEKLRARKAIQDKAVIEAKQYQPQDQPRMEDFSDAQTVTGERILQSAQAKSAYAAAMETWRTSSDVTLGRRGGIANDRDRDVAASDASFDTRAGGLQYQTEQQKFELRTQQQVADLQSQRKYMEAGILKEFSEFYRGLQGTREENKGQFVSTALSQKRADIQDYLTEVGRSEAQSVDVSRTVIGDPSHIRSIVNPLVQMQKSMSVMATFGMPWFGRR